MKAVSVATCLAMLCTASCGGGGGSSGGGGEPPPSPQQVVTADAGTDQAVVSGALVDLAGAAVANTGTVASFDWSQVSGPQVDILPATGGQLGHANFNAPLVVVDQVIRLQFTATGSAGASASDTVDIVVQAAAGTQPVQVTIQQGTLEGGSAGGLQTFLGVRFAAPPTGDGRFRPPVAVAFEAGVTPAKVSPPHCSFSLATVAGQFAYGSEDCLFLNVWAPADGQVHPVIVAYHGGRRNLLDGARLAATTGAVVVAPNRRVGILANLVLQELVDESPDSTAGNYGLRDAIEALRWVQQNIAAFGGDPSRVMVAGESAGGAVVCGLFAAPAANGLFHSAALLSPVCYPQYVLDASIAAASPFAPLIDLHRSVLAVTGCDDGSVTLDCLRSLPPEALVLAALEVTALAGPANLFPPIGPPATIFQPLPLIDGVVVVSSPVDGILNQVAGSFPVIAGSTRDEARNISPLPELDEQAYRDLLTAAFGTAADALYNLYPSNQYDTPTDAAYALYSDAGFGCMCEAAAEATSASSSGYLFEITRGLFAGPYVLHGVGGILLFDLLSSFNATPDPAMLDIVAGMQSGWGSLAGAPQLAPLVDAGASGQIVWPAYDPAGVEILDFGDPVAVASAYRGGRCPALRQVLGF